MDNKKEQERSALHYTRGSVDGWDCKPYVLGMLFYQFISENLTSYINDNEKQREAGGKNFSYAKLKEDEPFETIVSNPPYSIKWDGDANPMLINDERFTPAGILAPKSKADLAFVMHALSWLATNGTPAIACSPGVMYRGGAEQKIRQYLIDNNFIDAVIQLPPNMFFGTTIATCILALKKNKYDNKTLFIDATGEFLRGSAKNKLTNANIKRILDCYAGKEPQEYFSRLVDHAEIAENNYNISVGSYVVQKDEREIVDIAALNARIAQIVKRQAELAHAD